MKNKEPNHGVTKDTWKNPIENQEMLPVPINKNENRTIEDTERKTAINIPYDDSAQAMPANPKNHPNEFSETYEKVLKCLSLRLGTLFLVTHFCTYAFVRLTIKSVPASTVMYSC